MISIIKWFKNINVKNLYKLLKFYMRNFYPSIKQTLLHKAILFAKELEEVA